MEQSNKILTAVLAILIIGGCNPSNSNTMKEKINAYVVENSDRWASTKEIDTTNCVKLKLVFLNNPYKFNSKANNIVLYMSNKVIYNGEFKHAIPSVYVPKELFGRRLIPGMAISDETTQYNFIHKQSMFLSDGDQFLYIVFCPDNDLVGSCYLFSQKAEIL